MTHQANTGIGKERAMLTLKFTHIAASRLPGTKTQAITGVVASGNLEVLLERVLPDASCEIEIATPVKGYDATWKAVVDEFVARSSPGGLRISINDGGARPDTVYLRLMQGCALMEQT
jgi:malonate decarboxylase delta subunit